MDRTTLKIKGMSCDHCAETVDAALEGVDGVDSADVRLSEGRADVEYDEMQTDPRELVGAVIDEGYMAEQTPSS